MGKESTLDEYANLQQEAKVRHCFHKEGTLNSKELFYEVDWKASVLQ